MYSSEQEKIISVRKAAQQCGKNPETIRRWIWAGKLPAEKLGNQLFVKETALLEYVAGCAGKAGTMAEFSQRARSFRNKLASRGYTPVDSAAVINEAREERLRGLG